MSKVAISPRARRIILTGSLVMATVSGSLYGAYLKMDQDAKQAAQKYQSAGPQEKIDALLAVRKGLVTKQTMLQKQISNLEARMEGREVENKGRRGRDG